MKLQVFPGLWVYWYIKAFLKSMNVTHSPLFKEVLMLSGVSVFTPEPLRAVGVLISPMVSRWAGSRAGSGKKFVRAVSQKP